MRYALNQGPVILMWNDVKSEISPDDRSYHMQFYEYCFVSEYQHLISRK